MKLYEIDAALESYLEYDGTIIDPTTGEVVSPEDADNRMVLKLEEYEALQMEREAKVEAWGCHLKNCAAEIAALDKEIKALTSRKKAREHHLDASKARLQFYLAGEKFSSPKVAISYRTTKKVNFTGQAEDLPADLKRVKVSVEPDLIAIGKALKAGEVIENATLTDNTSMLVK